MAAKFSLFLCVLAIWVVGFAHSTSTNNAPSPTTDCSSLIMNMADCLSFVHNGSTETKPQPTCCSGLSTVLKAGPSCLCEGLKSSSQFGVVVNITKALTLPSACKLSAPPLNNCGYSITPAGAPASAPESCPTPGGEAPASGPAASEKAPVPSPSHNGSSLLSMSIVSLLVGLLVASRFAF